MRNALVVVLATSAATSLMAGTSPGSKRPQLQSRRGHDPGEQAGHMSVAKNSVMPSMVRKLPMITPGSPWVGSWAVTKPKL